VRTDIQALRALAVSMVVVFADPPLNVNVRRRTLPDRRGGPAGPRPRVSLDPVGTTLAIAFVVVCTICAVLLLRVAWTVYRGPQG